MNKNGFVPTSEADKVIWLNNFAAKIAVYASVLNITAAEVTAFKNDSLFYQYLVNMLEMFKQTVNTIVGYKNLLKHAVAQQHLGALPTAPVLATAPTAVPEGVFDRVSKMVQRIKAHPAYTDSIGQDMGIVAPVIIVDQNTLQPQLIVKMDAGRPHIKCAKGIADAMDLFVDRNDGAGFVLIGRLLKLDYIDTANLPANSIMAQWQYKAVYVIGNDTVGVMSAIEGVIVKKSVKGL